MKNSELLKKLEDFLSEMEKHQQLWKNSLGKSYGTSRILVVKNQNQLENQKKALNQKFGGFENYLSALLPSRRFMGNSFGTWDAWTTAIGDLRGLDKGKSMELFIRHLNQAIGNLQQSSPEEEFLFENSSDQSLTKRPTVFDVLNVLDKFNACSNYLQSKQKFPICSEDDVKDLLYVMLRSSFENVDWEESIPKAAGKSHRIDLLVKDCSTLVETKLVRNSSHEKNIRREINDDIIGYTTSNCEAFIAFIYDPQKLIIDPRLLSDFYKNLKTKYKFIDTKVIN